VDDCLQEYFAARARDLGAASDLARILRLDTLIWLPDDLLLKADKMTMAASVELRVPFLDHHLVEFAASLPDAFKLHQGQGKRILKEALQDLVPPAILQRRKRGFPVPIARWFREDLFAPAREILLDPRARTRAYFQPGYLERTLDRHRSGKEDLSRRILSVLILELWYRKYCNGEAPGVAQVAD
jgi:asparagine synthase (glutamine-hydrolysing)